MLFPRHCEERSDEAIQIAPLARFLDCFASLAMTIEFDGCENTRLIDDDASVIIEA